MSEKLREDYIKSLEQFMIKVASKLKVLPDFTDPKNGNDHLFREIDKLISGKHETVEKYLPCCATCTKLADSINGMNCTDIGKSVLRDDWCFDYISIELPKKYGKPEDNNGKS
ncbi:hypothetical protein KAR91_02410 [Candidatus Pacearchaeota archaeon]|nr:hypothetical protein [Candidatus Pacearchaeota archaeon]